jgi:hypothetical protein
MFGMRLVEHIFFLNFHDSLPLSLQLFYFCFLSLYVKMSGNNNEDLIDYEDEHDIVPLGGAAAAGTDEDKDKKNFSGISPTGFR